MAQANLGIMYTEGLGVSQDYREAVRWYRRAADQGYAIAQRNLGVMYAEGLGVSQDYVSAHMWLNLAGARGNDTARDLRDRVAREMSNEQIATAQKAARDWDAAYP